MIQRVLGAKNSYHARMGIVFAGFMKVLMPVIVVLPGLILFAMHPEISCSSRGTTSRPAADQGYVHLLQTLVPIGLRGLFLAALFGAIQSTVNSVLNSTATVFTLDIYKRWIAARAGDKHLVASRHRLLGVVLVIAIVLARVHRPARRQPVRLHPDALRLLRPAVRRRLPAWGSSGSGSTRRGDGGGRSSDSPGGIVMKVYLQFDAPTALGSSRDWLEPYANQAGINWAFCMVDLHRGEPGDRAARGPSRSPTKLTFNWRKLNIFDDLGNHWYTSVVTWWLLFVLVTVGLLLTFSGLVFPLR